MQPLSRVFTLAVASAAFFVAGGGAQTVSQRIVYGEDLTVTCQAFLTANGARHATYKQHHDSESDESLVAYLATRLHKSPRTIQRHLKAQ
ncbi:MAG: hypothetical protein AB7F99_04180 [Vicinamibacterales bacterium]